MTDTEHTTTSGLNEVVVLEKLLWIFCFSILYKAMIGGWVLLLKLLFGDWQYCKLIEGKMVQSKTGPNLTISLGKTSLPN